MSIIREERSAAFWTDVLRHPAVSALVGHLNPELLAQVVQRPNVLPLAAEHGGFLFGAIDSFGRVVELHTLFTPEGWGREVALAAKAAFEEVFGRGVDVVITFEMEANPRSQPPRSFGFRATGEARPSPWGEARCWILTADAWRASPARLRAFH